MHIFTSFSIPRDMYFDHAAADVDRKKEEANQQKPKQSKVIINQVSLHNVMTPGCNSLY